MIRLEDLMEEPAGLYYVGDIIDIDGSGWVDKETALKVLEVVNQE
jgi:hypothetical protein